MRINKQDFDAKIKSALSEKMAPSSHFEERLFASADALLEKRREFTTARTLRREAIKRSGGAVSSFGKGIFRRVTDLLGKFVEGFSNQPFAQVATAVALLIIVVLNRTHSQKPTLTVADLPEFPKINNAPAKYEAMWLAERKAYDKEVEDERRETSGGI